MSLDPATNDLITALETYCNSVRLCAGHANRVIALVNRVNILADLGLELHATLQVQYEAAKETLEAGEDPQPPAYIEFLATYEDYKIVYRLLQAAVAEAVTEKDFIDWHTQHTILPEYDAAMRHLGGGQ